MGNESSQIEKPQASQPIDLQDEDYNEDADADAASNAGSNKTTASRALARDLERSVMASSQENFSERPRQKRRKRKSAQTLLSAVEDGPDTAPAEQEAVISPIQNLDIDSKANDDDELMSNSNISEEGTARVAGAARKHLVKELRRMKKTVLVSSGKAKWAPRINGAKWEVEKLPPSQWPKRELTGVEEETLARFKDKVKEAKQRLAEFDGEAEEKTAGKGVENHGQMSENELATTDEIVHDGIANGQVTAQDVGMEESEVPTQPTSVKRLNKRERKALKKAQRKSNLNSDAEHLEPEAESQEAQRSHKKRKRNQTQTMTSGPPQPRGDEVNRPPLRSVAGKHKTELVTTWLNSQGPLDDLEEDPEQEEVERAEPTRKRKRVSKFHDDDDEEFQADQDDDEVEAPKQDEAETSEPKRKRTRVSKRPNDGDGEFQAEQDDDQAKVDSDHELPTIKSAPARAASARDSKNSKRSSQPKKQAQSEDSRVAPAQGLSTTSRGPFTAAEKSLADSIFSQVLRSEGIHEATLKHKMSSWRSVGTFKEEMEAAFPNRDKPSIRKFCQRRYHMQERGPWTAEQDEDLRNAQANYPDKWRKHQDLVGRTAADCKDRWTMHLQHSKTTGAWSQEEEANLVTAVEHAIELIKDDSGTDPDLAADRAALENAVSWKGISDELGNKRNNKQCREKWEKLKLREQKSSTNLNKKAKNSDGLVRQAELAKKTVKTFEIGDYYDIFVEIHTSFDDKSVRYHDDYVLWSIVSLKNPASRFSLTYQTGYLRRTALQRALQEWKIDSGKVRRKLERAETLQAKAKVLTNLLEKSYAGRLHAMSRTYMPEMIGKSKDEILQIKEENKRKSAEKRKERAEARRKIRSEQFVDDTDGEEEADLPGPSTPAVDDDDDEEDSDDERSDDEQSVCQRRLDAQINGREEEFEQEVESEADLPGPDARQHTRDVKVESSSSNDSSIPKDVEGQSTDAESDVEKEEDDPVTPKEESEDETESEDDPDRKPAVYDPNDPVHVEINRRLDNAIAEADASRLARDTVPHIEPEDEEADEDDGEEESSDDDEQAAEDWKNRYALSPGSEPTPVVSRTKFINALRR